MPRTQDLPLAASIGEVAEIIVNGADGRTRKITRAALLAGAEQAGAVAAHSGSANVHPMSSVNGLSDALTNKLDTTHADGSGGAKHALATPSVNGVGGSPGFVSAHGQEMLAKMITPAVYSGTLASGDLIPAMRSGSLVWVTAANFASQFGGGGPISGVLEGGEIGGDETPAVGAFDGGEIGGSAGSGGSFDAGEIV